MPWVPDAFSGGVIWQDKPSVATALDAANLNLEEQLEAAYAVALSQSVVDYLERWLGINGATISGYGPTDEWTKQGWTWDRVEVTQPGAAPIAAIEACLAAGASGVVVEFQLPGYAQPATTAFPTDSATINSYASYVAAAIATIEAAHPGVCVYELVNEVWTFYTGATATKYAAVVIAALQACQTAGLDLSRIYPMVQDQTWPAAMITAQSGLLSLIKGWCVHPYGWPPPSSLNLVTQGIASLAYFRLALMSSPVLGLGANNIIVSEVGVRDSSVDGSTITSASTAATGPQAAQWAHLVLRQAERFHRAGWLKLLLWYSRNDAGWALNSAGGALTSVGTALAEYPLEPDPPAQGGYSAADDVWLGATGDPYLFGDAVSLLAGKEHICRVRLDKGGFGQQITIYVDTAGAGLTAGQCFVSVRDVAGNLLTSASTDQNTGSDLATVLQGTGRKTIKMAAGVQLKPVVLFVGIGANGTTMPKLRGKLSGDQAWIGGLAALPTRTMTSVASFTTALQNPINYSTGVSRAASGLLLGIGS